MMKSSRTLARKILCGLLAAGVVGVSGSALAAFSYGYKVGTDTVDINTKFPDGVISGFDYGIGSSDNGNVSYKLPNIKIEAEVNSLYASKNGNITIGDKNSTIDLIIKERINNEPNIFSNNGKIEVLGARINIDSQSERVGVNSIKAKSGATIGIGNADTEKVTINTQGSGVNNSIVNLDTSKVNVNAVNIEVLTKNNASGNTFGKTIGVYNNANGSITMGSDITEQITINTVASGEANTAYGLYNSQTGSIEVKTSKLNLKSSANGNSYGIYGGAKNEINIKNASIVSVEAESSSKNAYAVSGRNGKTSIQADTINLTAKSNTDNEEYQASAVFSSLKYNVYLVGKDINLYAKGAVAETVGVQGRSDDNNGAVYNINGDNINITAEGSKNARALNIIDKSNLALGNSNSNINIRSNAKDAYGIVGMTGGTANVNGQSLKIDVTSDTGSAEAIHVQNNTEDATDNLATVNVNTAKTVINAKTGIAAYSQGVVNMNNGDVEINAEKAIETRGNAETTINKDGSHTVKINGDIVFDYDGATSGTGIDSNVNVNLNGEGSSWTGNTKAEWNSANGKPDAEKLAVSNMKLNVLNGAQWNPTTSKSQNNASNGKYDIAINNLALNNGIINLDSNNFAGDNAVQIENLEGTGGTINTNNVDNNLSINSKAADTSLTVNGTKEVTDAIASGNADLQKLADVVKSNGKSAADTVTSDANDIIGGYSAKVDGEGNVQANTIKTLENPTNRAISDMANISLMTWRQENNDMNKRLGELRDSKGEHGAWARMARGESKYGSQNVKNQYNYYQVGYDEKLSTNPNWTVGVALTRTEGTSTFARGTGENKHTGFAVYGSYLNDNGSFVDLIAKYARMDNDYSTIGAGVGDASYETNGYSLSAEYGKRFTKDNGFWIEPQVELTYGTVGSVDYLTSKGARVHQDSVDSLVGRLGFSLGKDIKQGNVYVRASYLYDFDGETKATMSGNGTDSFEQDLGGGWWEVGVGTNLNLSDATHLYFDVEKTYGGNVATPWQWNAGVRWSF